MKGSTCWVMLVVAFAAGVPGTRVVAEAPDGAPNSACEAALTLAASPEGVDYRFAARITNQGGEAMTLVQPGDGSFSGRRTPVMRWLITPIEVSDNAPLSQKPLLECGNINPIARGETFLLHPGGTQDLRWIEPPRILRHGRYRLALTYSNLPDHEISGIPLGPHDAETVDAMRSSTPCQITSNEVEIDVAVSEATIHEALHDGDFARVEWLAKVRGRELADRGIEGPELARSLARVMAYRAAAAAGLGQGDDAAWYWGSALVLDPELKPTAWTSATPALAKRLNELAATEVARRAEVTFYGQKDLPHLVKPKRLEAPVPQCPKNVRRDATVRIMGFLGKDGRLRSPRFLDAPESTFAMRYVTLEILLDWRYTPYKLNRKPIVAPHAVAVNFIGNEPVGRATLGPTP